MEEEKKLTGGGAKCDLQYPKVNKTVDSKDQCKVYKMRWVILFIFMVYTVAAGVQWMQYSIISEIMAAYYKVGTSLVEWTTMLHMSSYIVCILPALWMLETMGNRVTMLTAGAGICIGAWIKLFAVYTPFYLVLIGQAIEASAQVLTFSLAGSVTATWFGPNEIAIAGSLALFGDQLGAGLGFVLPPLYVSNGGDDKIVGEGLYNLCLTITVLTTSIFAVMVVFFKESPAKPPSNAQIVRREVKKSGDTMKNFKKMMTKRSFLLMLAAYGLHIGVFNAHATLLSRVFGEYFEGQEKDAGAIGALIIFCGLIGAIISGLFLDWKHLFKQTSIFLFMCSAACFIGYTFALYFRNLALVYTLACLMGVFMWGYYSVGLQMAIELVHPYSEGCACGLMLLAAQVTGLILTFIYRAIFENFKALKANLFLAFLLIIGILISFLIPPNYRRQEAEDKVRDNQSAIVFIRSFEELSRARARK